MRRLFSIIFASILLQACGSNGSVATTNPPPIPAKEDEEKDPAPDQEPDADQQKIRKSRELRRAYIALTHSLPNAQLVNDYTNGTINLSDQLRNLVNSNDFVKALSAELIDSWKLSLDFSQGRRDQNSALIPTFSATDAESIHGELQKLLQFHLQQNTPYPLWFSHSYSVMHKDLVSDANFTSLRQLYPGDNFLIGNYADGRFQAGILTSNAIRLVADRNRLIDKAAAASKILQAFYCSHQDQADAHNFKDIQANDLADLSSLSHGHGSCAQCHQDTKAIARYLPMASGDGSLAEWFTLAQNEEFEAGFLFSHPYSNAAELKNILNSDSRIGSCLIKNLVKIYMRRELNDNDQKILSGLYASYEEHQQVRDLALHLTSEPSFWTGLTIQELKRNQKIKARVLNLNQFKSILKNLQPTLILTEASLEQLTPNAGSSLKDQNDFAYKELIVMRAYARQFADQTVDLELTSQSVASKRQLLTTLSDGLVTAESSNKIQEQIIGLHSKLTGLSIESTSDRYKGLKKLWDGESRTSETGYKNGWKAILMAILLSSDFLIY